ncbi:Tetratricopeptide repeat protein 36, partial [Quaeritorhiza haematococci]
SGFAPIDDNADDDVEPPTIDPEMLERVKAIEVEALDLAERKNDLDGTIEKLSEAIGVCPVYASAYNNRAQAYRMKGETDLALQDLELAIQHGVRNNNILKQAYTQRAIIKKQKGDIAGSEADFAQGAKYGNQIAKAVVRNNPYAK